MYIVNGKQMTGPEIEREYGIGIAAFRSRLNRGWTAEDAVSKPVGKVYNGGHWYPKYEVDGERLTMPEITEKYGVSAGAFKSRIRRGMSATEAAKTPVRHYVDSKHGKNAEGYSDPTATKAIDNAEPADIPKIEIINQLKVDGVEVHAGTIWKTRFRAPTYVFVIYVDSVRAIVMGCWDMNEEGFDKAYPNVNTDFIIGHYLVDPRYINIISGGEGAFVSLETYMTKDNTSFEAYLNLSAYCPELAASVIRSDRRMITMFRKRIEEYKQKIDELEKNAPSESQLEADEPEEDIENLKGENEILIAGGQRLAGENVDLQNRILELEQQLKYYQLIVDAQVTTYGRKTVEYNVGRYVLENRRGDSNEVE